MIRSLRQNDLIAAAGAGQLIDILVHCCVARLNSTSGSSRSGMGGVTCPHEGDQDESEVGSRHKQARIDG